MGVRSIVLGLAVVVAAVSISCSAEVDQRSAEDECLGHSGTTTLAVEPPPAETDDKSVLPPLDDPGRYGSRARIRAIEGYEVDEAQAWASESGWTEVQVIDADNPVVEPRPAIYDGARIGLCERDGLVIQAWTGGW